MTVLFSLYSPAGEVNLVNFESDTILALRKMLHRPFLRQLIAFYQSALGTRVKASRRQRHQKGAHALTTCPFCKTEVPTPSRSWLLANAQTAGGQKLFLSLFQCQHCGADFTRHMLSWQKPVAAMLVVDEASVLRANVKNRIDGLIRLEGMLMQTLKELHEKIKLLEDERAKLQAEVADLRKAAEARVATLEGEVGQLKADAKALKELLAAAEQQPPVVQVASPGAAQNT